jgi:large subunit ribosomal protein L23
MQVLSVLVRPIVTEKSTLMQDQNKYVFEITPRATKSQVKVAVEKGFNVKVLAVNVLKARGEHRRIGNNRRLKKLPDQKKAIVTLKPGDTIQVFEGA